MQLKHLIAFYLILTILLTPYVYIFYNWTLESIIGCLFCLAGFFVVVWLEMPVVEEKPIQRVKPRIVNKADFQKKKNELIKAKNSKIEKAREAEVVKEFQGNYQDEWRIRKVSSK